MPRRSLTPAQLQELHELAAQWGKIIARRACDDEDATLDLDLDFDAVEQIAQAAAAGLNEGTLEILLEQQADARPDPSPCAGGDSIRANRFAMVPTAAGIFSPQRPLLRLDGHGYSPAVLQQIVTAGARLHSFSDAAFALSLTGLSISARHVQQLTQEVGRELAAARDEQAQQRRRRELKPQVAETPAVVAVEVDGGRLRTRAPSCGPGVHHAESKEDKIACLVTLQSVEHAEDPCPEPPPSYLEPRRIQRLVKQMAGRAGDQPPAADEAADSASPAAAEAVSPPATAKPEDEPWAPRRLMRTCVASLEASRSFGPLMAGEAQARHFYGASRRVRRCAAPVADGQAYNGTIQRGYFPDFVPIVDFLHVICYLFAAAHTEQSEAKRWPQYLAWLRACQQGRSAEVVAELEQRQMALGRPPPGEKLAANDARQIVAEALSYLRNNAGRMDYPSYRRQGLPTTSSLVESLVGEFNARMKGREKFWNRPGGAEAILQVRAALLSEDGRLARHFATRGGSAYRRRRAAASSRPQSQTCS